ncbi:MAG TPA: Uma2 family endonuclease [Verrucomicrobiae bacterium]|nr:Uma2 family endonuclease [Verrucomicrobiae bacterium]
MATLTIKLPPHEAQMEFNLRRWDELLADPEMHKIEGRVETDRFGHVIKSPPPAPKHGFYQAEILRLLHKLMPRGRVLPECPISTADGVRAADVAWASSERIKELGNRQCFSHAPEICVEVLSPGNSEAEIEEKIALYFEAGAGEVWICGLFGDMRFFSAAGAPAMGASKLCSKFPARIKLRLDS